MSPADPVVRLREELSALDRAYTPGHHGRWLAHRRSDVLDAALTTLLEEAGSPEGVALAALGGYGRGELLPDSDVDLLIVHDGGRAAADVEALAQRILYPLWDAGLDVGQAVRTPAECAEAATARLDTTTAMLDLRPIAGATTLSQDARARVLEPVRADPQGVRGAPARGPRGSARALRFRRSPARARAEGGRGRAPRHRDAGVARGRPGRAARGRRAPQVARARCPRGGRGVPRRGSAAPFTSRPGSAPIASRSTTSRRVARAMGFTDEPRLIAEDGLMRAVFEHARAVTYVVDAVFERFLNPQAAMGTVEVTPLDAAGVLEALAASAEEGSPPAPAVLDAIEARRCRGSGRLDDAGPGRVPQDAARRRRGGRRPGDARPARSARALPARVGRRALPSPARSLPPVHGRHAPERGPAGDRSDGGARPRDGRCRRTRSRQAG